MWRNTSSSKLSKEVWFFSWHSLIVTNVKEKVHKLDAATHPAKGYGSNSTLKNPQYIQFAEKFNINYCLYFIKNYSILSCITGNGFTFLMLFLEH